MNGISLRSPSEWNRLHVLEFWEGISCKNIEEIKKLFSERALVYAVHDNKCLNFEEFLAGVAASFEKRKIGYIFDRQVQMPNAEIIEVTALQMIVQEEEGGGKLQKRLIRSHQEFTFENGKIIQLKLNEESWLIPDLPFPPPLNPLAPKESDGGMGYFF